MVPTATVPDTEITHAPSKNTLFILMGSFFFKRFEGREIMGAKRSPDAFFLNGKMTVEKITSTIALTWWNQKEQTICF